MTAPPIVGVKRSSRTAPAGEAGRLRSGHDAINNDARTGEQ